MNAKQQHAAQQAADRRMTEKVARNGGRIIAMSSTKVAVYFAEQEDAYLYDRADEARYTWIPGRPLMHLIKSDSSQEEFEALVEKLV